MTGAAPPMPRAEAAELLGVPVDAGPAEVQRAFVRAARHVHPDTLPDAAEPERRIATDAFGRLLRARDVLLEQGPDGPDPAPVAGAAYAARPHDPSGPRYRQVEGRGLGGSLVVLALLAFLLVALVTWQQGSRPDPFAPPAPAPPVASRNP